MLQALSIRDIVLIDRADLTFSDGLTVFTGETGAGKSIILDSLALALGARGDAGLIRAGAACASVSASFDIVGEHPALALAQEHGLEDGDALILKRTQQTDGRTRAFVNDRPVSTSLLRQIGQSLVEIHGQHDDRALVDSAAQRELLDRFGGLTQQTQGVSKLWAALQEAARTAEALAADLARAERDSAYLTAWCEELNALAPEPGEEDRLAARRQEAMSKAKAREDLEAIADALAPGQFPSQRLNALLRRLERQSGVPETLKPVAAALDRMLIEAEEARALVGAELRIGHDDNVEGIEERLFRLRAVARKHRVSVSELSSLHERLRSDFSKMEMGALRVQEAQARLLAARQAAAENLDRAVQKELKPLRLEKAQFLTNAAPLVKDGKEVGGPFGLETITFYVQTNPGSKPGPLMKVASGGELARFILALKVASADQNATPVLVFDEIDTGAGGATAAAIGDRLSRLGRQAQVLAITHSPQVAAHADAHYKLEKSSRGLGDNIAVETSAEALDVPGRREEIARMLAGQEVTQEARAAAARLLEGKRGLG